MHLHTTGDTWTVSVPHAPALSPGPRSLDDIISSAIADGAAQKTPKQAQRAALRSLYDDLGAVSNDDILDLAVSIEIDRSADVTPELVAAVVEQALTTLAQTHVQAQANRTPRTA